MVYLFYFFNPLVKPLPSLCSPCPLWLNYFIKFFLPLCLSVSSVFSVVKLFFYKIFFLFASLYSLRFFKNLSI